MALSASALKDKIKPSIVKAFETILMQGVVQANFTKVEEGIVVPDRVIYNSTKNKAVNLAYSIANRLSNDLAKSIVSEVRKADVICTIPRLGIATQTGGAGPPTTLKISGRVK